MGSIDDGFAMSQRCLPCHCSIDTAKNAGTFAARSGQRYRTERCENTGGARVPGVCDQKGVRLAM